jgi:hypothetical protein
MNPQRNILGFVMLLLGLCFVSNANASDSASTSIEMTGDAKPVCRLPSPSTQATANASFSGNKMVIEQLLDETNATVKASQVRLTFAGVMCNYNAYLVLSSANGGMTRISGSDDAIADSGTFLKRVDYKVVANWGTVKIDNFNTATLPENHTAWVNVGGANSADLGISIITEDGSIPVLQGHYSDTLTIKVGSTY